MDIPANGLRTCDDGVLRCFWCASNPLYLPYHDGEWGFPSKDDTHLFEKICLEGFQAGLSWITILRKRPAFREAFRGFDVQAVARFTKRDVNSLLKNEKIIRHRRKIESAINNARRTIELIEECGSLASFIWRFEPDPSTRPKRMDWPTLRRLTETAESAALSKALKQRGFTFVGPTTMYALMQSVGLVNDHLEGCAARRRAESVRKRFRRPA